ncbi:MAG: hypothetical protein MI725_02005, partial [Pirellulales bacterium]|nr:hypothetical protein [Pirellulales bacterium]
MSNRATSENSNAVGLFPFLAVLLCTMGALLVLLVVMAQRAGKRTAAKLQTSTTASQPEGATSSEDSEAAAQLVRRLDRVREYQKQLDRLNKQTSEQLREEKERLSHLEEHSRRLEHELARLTIAAQQLEATEQNQVVDEQQAELQLAQLQQLIQEKQDQLDELRSQGVGNRSYAIVPYKGLNGTYRKPIYIECSKEGVFLHPEGVRLEKSDFLATSWSGNPLAAALRASRGYLNAKAAREKQPEPPEPYPLLLVRPDGILQYARVRAAIQSWDNDFGYEFIDSDWQLEFPELPDPQLAEVQQHAILMARDRLQRLVQSAPSRFLGVDFGGGGSGAGGKWSETGWGTGGSSAEASGEVALLAQADGASPPGNGQNNGQTQTTETRSDSGDSHFASGAGTGDATEAKPIGAHAGTDVNKEYSGMPESTQNSDVSESDHRYAQTGSATSTGASSASGNS